mmetsp:Transcript_16003/g.30449  ORF Transcript_16003/g.30449 Transcript_16003/m.30449 type:complete len:142 (+) Transcript_16003:94-519(+)
MNQSTEERLAQERLRRQANNTNGSQSRRRTQQPPLSSHAYWTRAVATGNVTHVHAWLHHNLPPKSALAASQRQRLQQTLHEGVRLARQHGHDEVVNVILQAVKDLVASPSSPLEKNDKTVHNNLLHDGSHVKMNGDNLFLQ